MGPSSSSEKKKLGKNEETSSRDGYFSFRLFSN